MVLKYLPNAFSLTRLMLIAPFLFFLHQSQFSTALYIFLFAGLTDGLDGWLARLFNWQTRFGSFIDPVADKLLIASSFISLALLGQLPWWLVSLVFFRDLTISLGVMAWQRFIPQRLDFKPTWLSKINTFLQLTLIIFCLIELAFGKTSHNITYILIGLTAFTTSVTYIDYVWTGARRAYASSPVPQ
ncbi:MAG: CDP-alcohol phosphatidyltransferase family protein [Legionellaceae bacterium]|nr:CDP-alcohol phosphatidyltransferase family protein [Legionellaceae bacterium]